MDNKGPINSKGPIDRKKMTGKIASTNFESFGKKIWPTLSTGKKVFLAAGVGSIVYYFDYTLGFYHAWNLWKKMEPAHKDSARLNDVAYIAQRVLEQEDVEFDVVRGPSGIGKTTAVKCATRGMRGVISIPGIKPGMDQDSILNKVSSIIVGKSDYFLHDADIKSTISWYKMFSGGATPIVIMSASQRQLSQQPADLTSAARYLRDEFKIKVLIDASENALPEKLTGHENILEMEPLSEEIMRSLPDFKYISETLKMDKNYQQVILAICSGRPLLLWELVNKIRFITKHEQLKNFDNTLEKTIEAQPDKLVLQEKKLAVTRELIEQAVRAFVDRKLIDAHEDINRFAIKYPEFKEVLNKFKTEPNVEKSDLLYPSIACVFAYAIYEGKLDFPDFKDVLRQKSEFLVPATCAVEIYLRKGYEKKLYFDEFKSFVTSPGIGT